MSIAPEPAQSQSGDELQSPQPAPQQDFVPSAPEPSADAVLDSSPAQAMACADEAPAAESPSSAPATSPAAVPVPVASISPRELLESLRAEFPVFAECRPLALRIDVAIAERRPEVSRKLLRTTLRMHTGATRYLKAMERGTQRFDLAGNPVGEVTEEHRKYAQETLQARFAEVARQRKATRAEEEARRKAEEAEMRHQEKLNELVGRFSRER